MVNLSSHSINPVITSKTFKKKNNAKNVLLIEQGRNIKNRSCPIEKAKKCLHCKPYCNITSGFSGAGAFSDG